MSKTHVSRILMKPDARIGIINRGEAAVRFIRAVNEYNALYGTNLQTVSFYLPVDQHAVYVKEADLACPFASLETFSRVKTSAYLDYDLLIEALASMDCHAVWLGWGFLAEDSVFVAKLEEQGIASISPNSKSMALLGDKIEAKRLAERADVPVCPWSGEPVVDYKHAVTVADEIGFPLIIKAALAGGGRGIRMVHTPDDLEHQFQSAWDETLRITGDSILFIEYMVSKGRHLEVQIIADYFGHVGTFGVRDCSVQRRNQKIIEETPPPNFPQSTIKEMEAAASRLILAAEYENAGTVEFIYDLDKKQFFFMEVNTRLQVEHPITETLYNIDLVKQQIHVALGNKLSLNGHPVGVAIELRLNAEDPDRDFTPSPGEVSLFAPPTGPGIRIDSGIEEGSSIPKEFDSMIAKIIAHGNTRAETISRLQRALREIKIKIEGGTTNRAFLLDLLRCPEIQQGGVHTRFVEELMGRQTSLIRRDDWDIALIVSAIRQYILQYMEELVNFQGKFHRLGPPRDITKTSQSDISFNLKGRSYNFKVKSVGNNIFHLEIGGQQIVVQYLWKGEEAVLLHDQHRYNIQIVSRGDILQCEVNGVPYPLEVESQGVVRAPSPAIVLSIAVKAEQKIKKGDLLLTLEAMKMEMIVSAPTDGIIRKICVRDGEQVSAGQPLIELDTTERSKDKVKEVISEPPINFERLAVPPPTQSKKALVFHWELIKREFLGLLLGYDSDQPLELLQKLLQFAEQQIGYFGKFVQTLIDAIDIFVAIEKLFSRELLQREGTARALDSQELLMHFFWRVEDREKGLPQEFMERLNRAISWYPWAAIENTDACTRALFRIYKSHANLSVKLKLIASVLFQMEETLPKYGEGFASGHLTQLLSELAVLFQEKSPSLSDLAVHARYTLLDLPALRRMKDEKNKKVKKLLDKLVVETDIQANLDDDQLNDIYDAGPRIVNDLMLLAIQDDADKTKLALELIGKRFCRDRSFKKGQFISNKDKFAYICQSEDNKKSIITIVTILNESDYDHHGQWLETEILKQNQPCELILLVDTEDVEANVLYEYFEKTSFSTELSCVGFKIGNNITYRTYSHDKDGKWGEDVQKRFLSPLIVRELRFDRLQNFDLELTYNSETIFVYKAVAKSNPRDERIFALVDVPEARPEFNAKGNIQRIVAFENAFVEVSQAIRVEQAQRKRRLYWNRIIMHVRSPLMAQLKQIRNYATMISPRARGMGLEKVVVYTRIKRGKNLRETEFMFENISGPLFSLRSRVPSTKSLVPMDAYVAKVVRARQRGMVYPYQIIRMITQAETGNQRFPKGTFDEFDIQKNIETGEYELITITKGYKRECNNIVFGLINNSVPLHPYGLKRVLILSDPTLDMCALGEAECSRIICALDLAEKNQLPVEWIAISAGARIDMNSGTENLDWTARTLKRIIHFTQQGGEINIIVPGINVGAQSYWNAEATMLMHTKGLLIMTDDGAMLLTGKKALDFSGSVSAEDNIGIGGVERIMGPNGEAQLRAPDLSTAYQKLLQHYNLTYRPPGQVFPDRQKTKDSSERDICQTSYNDILEQGFTTIGDILYKEKNPERKKPFDMRQVMDAIIDNDCSHLERWQMMQDAETAIVWETRIGGFAVGLIGIESRSLSRLGAVPNDGPESWSGGTLFPQSSKKVARALNAWSRTVPVVVMANLSGFDGSPESLRNVQLEFGAEIGRAVVNFKGPIIFVIVARYHGGAYVVFSQSLNPHLKAVALEHTYASVIGGAPAAAVVFQRNVIKDTFADPRVKEAQSKLKTVEDFRQKDFDDVYQQVLTEKQTQLAQKFDSIHSVERAKKVGSITDIIPPHQLRSYLISAIEEGMDNYLRDY